MQYIDQIIAPVIALAFGVIWAVKGGQFPQDVTLIVVTWLFRGGVPKLAKAIMAKLWGE